MTITMNRRQCKLFTNMDESCQNDFLSAESKALPDVSLARDAIAVMLPLMLMSMLTSMSISFSSAFVSSYT